MKTALAQPNPPFDIRACPIWAIPQLGWFQFRERGWIVISFRQAFGGDLNDSYGFFVIKIPGEGYYEGIMWKSNMNTPGPIALECIGWIL